MGVEIEGEIDSGQVVPVNETGAYFLFWNAR